MPPRITKPITVDSRTFIDRIYKPCLKPGAWQYNWPDLPQAWYGLAAAKPTTNNPASPRFYVVGGDFGGSGFPSSEAWYYMNNAWAQLPHMLTPRLRHASVCVGDKLYVLGGLGTTTVCTASVEKYDPASGNWTYVAPMPTARSSLAVAELGGMIYAVGGLVTYTNGSFGYLKTLEIYDPVHDVWVSSVTHHSTLKAMSEPRMDLAAVAINGLLYAVGGWGPKPLQSTGRTLEVYDPALTSWTTLPSMPTGRAGLAAAVLDGKLYVMGGLGDGQYKAMTGGAAGISVLSVVEAYDPGNNRWCIAPDMQIPRGRLAAVTLTHAHEGRKLTDIIYAIGGFKDAQAPMQTSTDTVEVYPRLPP